MAGLDPSLVADVPIFRELTRSQVEDILGKARSARFTKNAHIFEQGAEAQSFFLLLHGHVQALKVTPTGEQVVVRYVSPGEIFGVAHVIGLNTYPATAVAVVDSVALIWPASIWSELVRSYPTLASGTLQTVGTRLQEAHARVIEISTEEVERRVARALLRLANQAGRKVDRGIEIDFPISRQNIAEMTGTTLHTVSRILSAWEQGGIVESGRQRVVLRDAHRLMAIAEAVSD
ncbi:Crp/Fnr family transcriptional regulator [Taklimakanibacter lacteus]|uniref:Crp/Fnr family transcriptional regulator n=1 Tax=Taklimakanibacter lacteus TaxID=2268456 RepID=UPI000E664C2A